MTILRWNPAEELYSLRREMSRLMEDSWLPTRFTQMVRPEERVMRLPLDAYTTDEELVITAAVPGLNPDDVEIVMEDDVLTIKGELRAPLENVTYLFQERPYGRFSRSVTVNVPVDADQAEAKFDKGVLTVILPKLERARPKVIEVKAK
ncbi:MAG: Hsp20/alpha crystallin family protein [Anaerolineae bacterium]|nr:Hsp20/alpha crystallin family protein [Anaerolineae bacterium]